MSRSLFARRVVWMLCALSLGGCVLACGSSKRAEREVLGGSAEHKLQHQGRERSYRLFVPEASSGSKAMPLVMALHGGGGDAERLERGLGLNALATTHGFAVVYPQGVERSWNDGRSSEKINAQRLAVDDVGFLSAVIEAVGQEIDLDPDRVYIMGISNGAMMSFRMICERAELFAAAATAIGMLPKNLEAQCAPSRPVPLLSLMGTEDPIVPYEGGGVGVFRKDRGEVLSAAQTVSRFVAQHGCEAAPIKTEVRDLDRDDGVSTEIVTYGGEGCVPVVHVRVVGGGHTVPGLPSALPARVVGAASHDIDAMAMFWSFFQAQAKGR